MDVLIESGNERECCHTSADAKRVSRCTWCQRWSAPSSASLPLRRHSSISLAPKRSVGSGRGRTVDRCRRFPDSPPAFEILYSNGDQGLMVYEGYVYVVRLGDKLPNGRRMIGFQNGTETGTR